PFSLSPHELELVEAGMADAVGGAKPRVELSDYQMKIRDLFQGRLKASTEKVKETGKKFIEEATRWPGAVKTESAMVFQTLKAGSGDSPASTDRVKVNYEGKLVDGTVFDSSYKRNQPMEFAVGNVIPCWTEALQRMKVGEKAKLACPSSIAYGDGGRPP